MASLGVRLVVWWLFPLARPLKLVLSWPGCAAHELVKRLVCRLAGISVHQVCYWRVGSPMVYVEHESPVQLRHGLALSLVPWLITTVIALGIAWAAVGLEGYAETRILMPWMTLLAVAIGIGALPSMRDARDLWQAMRRQTETTRAGYLVAPAVAFTYAGAVAPLLWLDVLYGLAVGFVLPRWLNAQL
jgi:hypothetical protein